MAWAPRYTDGNETYTFVPVEPVGARSLTIYRNSGDIVLNRKWRLNSFMTHDVHQVPKHQTRPYLLPRNGRERRYMALSEWSLCSCVSSEQLLASEYGSPGTAAEYVIILTGREQKGTLMGQNIYHATEYDILPLNPDVSVSNPSNPVEAHLQALVRSHLYGGYFLFSYGWDLTRRLQAQWTAMEGDRERSMWEAVRGLNHTLGASVSLLCYAM